MAKLKIVSVNVRGIGTQHKRRDVMHFLKNMNCDIIMLQDTHLIKAKISSFNSLWTGKAYHSCYTNNSRGTSILINNKLHHDIISEYTGTHGNYIIIQCKIGTDSYVLGSIYGPNRDEPQFYEHIDEILDSVDCDHIFIGGDFNFVMDAENDCYGYARENNVNARRKFISVCNKHNLIDIWRHQNPTQHQYTWFTEGKGSRLDMFFVSNHLSSSCSDIQIVPGYRTDHSIISMCLQTGESQRGPGLWKFNESLLKDDEYVAIVKDCINRTVKEYAVPVYANEYLFNECNYKDIQFHINDGLFYETLLMMIRGETVKYSKMKAKRRRAKEKEVIASISRAQETFAHTKADEDARRLQVYKDQLENLRKPLINGLIVRSRTTWHEDGEKSSKYFLGLEKRNAMRKTVSVLTVDEHKITRTSSILQNFTEDLARKYSKVHIMPPSADDFIGENIFASLSAVERSLLDQPMSFTELTNALQKMKKGKSPGSNGYTACFFKFFWKELGPFLYRAFLFSASQGKTLLTHREGIITMIPKAGKPPDSVKGWRPITLLNIDFKIISSALSARLQSVVDKLIDPCQTAYIKGRYIGENTRLVYDVIEHLLARQKTSLIMSADFEAAFDSISWEFVRKALNHYGFGPYFKDMINTLYLNPNNFSRIIINGHLGDKIHLKCGIRQGDPASGYLFNLAVNILAQQIKRSDRITGIRLSESNEVKISQYADDTLLFLNNTSGCLQGALEELKTFSEASGLHLNIEKNSLYGNWISNSAGKRKQSRCKMGEQNEDIRYNIH